MEAALILKIISMMQAGFTWLADRGVQRDRVQFLIDRAVAAGRDVTTAEVQTELDATQKELDATAAAIGNLPEDPQ